MNNELTDRESRRLMESLEFTFKQHYDAEQIWLARHYWLGVPATIGTAATAALAAVEVPVGLVVGLATVSAILIALTTFLRPDRIAAKHRQAATQMQALHERIRGWSTIERLQQSTEIQTERLAVYRTERSTLQSCSPALPRKTYHRVKAGIEAGETEFEVDTK